MARSSLPRNQVSKGKRASQKQNERTKKLSSAQGSEIDEGAADFAELEQLRDEETAKWCLSKATREAYAGQIRRAKAWLTVHVRQRKKATSNSQSAIESNKMDLEELEAAFNTIPNRYSPYALEMLLTERCLKGGASVSTGQSMYSALKNQWKNVRGGKYRGAWMVDEETGKVSGNPADADDVQNIMRAIGNKDRSQGGRDHAEAMTIEDMRKMMNWSESVVSAAVDWCTEDVQDLKLLLTVAKHLETRAFLSMGFTLWTRNMELCKLQSKHYRQDCVGLEPHFLEHDLVTLENRKGWTSSTNHSDAACIGHKYELHDQKSTPEIDGRRHMRTWIAFLETRLLRRKLLPEEFLFPAISTNGTPYTDKPCEHSAAQRMMEDFAKGAGVTTQYSTHSLRRGGAQYRFMYCPVGERWSLSTVRWWGGWAEGEHSDTLVKYLINELSRYEKGHSDALSPAARDAARRFMGDRPEDRGEGASAADLKLFSSTMNRQLGHLGTIATQISSGLAALGSLGLRASHGCLMTSYSGLVFSPHLAQPTPHVPQPASPAQAWPPSHPVPRPSVVPPYDQPALGSGARFPHATMTQEGGPSPPVIRPQANPAYNLAATGPVASALPWQPPYLPTLPSAYGVGAPAPTFPSAYGVGAPAPTLPSAYDGYAAAPLIPTFTVPPLGQSHDMEIGPPAPERALPAVPEARIPRLPRGAAGWRTAIQQWDHGDPATKRPALKDWREDWFTGEMRKVTGSKYGQRRLIAEEYIRLGRDDTAFLTEYPEASESVTSLLKSIRAKRCKRRKKIRSSEAPGASTSDSEEDGDGDDMDTQ